MSLREFMDLVVAEHGDPSEAFAHTPLLSVRGIGKIGYYSVAAELTTKRKEFEADAILSAVLP